MGGDNALAVQPNLIQHCIGGQGNLNLLGRGGIAPWSPEWTCPMGGENWNKKLPMLCRVATCWWSDMVPHVALMKGQWKESSGCIGQ